MGPSGRGYNERVKMVRDAVTSEPVSDAKFP